MGYLSPFLNENLARDFSAERRSQAAAHRLRRQPQNVYEQAWASVMSAYVEQADGNLPVAVVRVQNLSTEPVFISATTKPRGWAHRRYASGLLKVRSPRRRTLPEGEVLGVVEAGAVRVWHLALGPGRLPVVKVRLDPHTRIFTWALTGSGVTEVAAAHFAAVGR